VAPSGEWQWEKTLRFGLSFLDTAIACLPSLSFSLRWGQKWQFSYRYTPTRRLSRYCATVSNRASRYSANTAVLFCRKFIFFCRSKWTHRRIRWVMNLTGRLRCSGGGNGGGAYWEVTILHTLHRYYTYPWIYGVQVINQVAVQPGFDLDLCYRVLAVCSAHNDKFSQKSSGIYFMIPSVCLSVCLASWLVLAPCKRAVEFHAYVLSNVTQQQLLCLLVFLALYRGMTGLAQQ